MQRNPILEFPNLGPVPGSTEPILGPGPGALSPGINTGGMGTSGAGVIGGRRRNGRIPRGGKKPAGVASMASRRTMQLPEQLPMPSAPRGTAIPATLIDDEILSDIGPADGLTLDAAIDRMLAANPDIRALRHELTQADADVLTAGLRTNPLIYMDSQFIPYGAFTDQRPGGPTQYDVNITLPVDVSRKRQARQLVARMARTSLESQFQDVTRRHIDNVYQAFVSLQAARLDRLVATASVTRQEQFLEHMRRTTKPDDEDAADTIDHLEFALERARNSLGEAEEAHADAQEGLAVLLNLPVEQTDGLEPYGRLREPAPALPSSEELAALALRCRADLHAARIGINRANAEVKLERANRFDDVYLFYDPITIQDNRPIDAPNSRSWAVGLTFALPVFNRNQGNIARAESNATQTRIELSALERRVASEVRLAERELKRSQEALAQIEEQILPKARATLDRKTKHLIEGGLTIDDYQGHLDDASEVTQSHRDALVRYRRAMLDLNTAIGLRLLP
jgi:cobalt-zinc-cadmium efflux system outer membrane protein